MLKKLAIIISLLVILSMALTTVGLAQEDVQTAADAYFSAGAKNISADDLFEILNDGDDSNDPFIIDARSPEDYALGHIPGAVNIGPKVAFTADKLAMIPEDTPVVVYCYTGQTSSQMVPALNMLGYDAKSMLYGFPAWANVGGITGPKAFDPAVDQSDYKISTEAAEATETYDLATPLDSTVAGAAEAYFANGTRNIAASDLFDNLNDGDTSNDPFLVDVRKAEDYAAGHIPGAVNMNAAEMFSAENLAKLPPDQPIVVNCYTGQTASQVTSALNMLGYDAVNLKFGFASWSPSGAYTFSAANSPNYRFEGTGEAIESAEVPGMPAPALVETSEAEVGAYTWTFLTFKLGPVNEVVAATAAEDGAIWQISVTSTEEPEMVMEMMMPVLEAFEEQ